MAGNIVIFGMAHSGKSTLVGYMISELTKLDLEKYIEDIKREYPDYIDEDAYTYLTDTSKDERVKQKIEDIGKTKDIHFKNVALPSGATITIIDTPGAAHRSKTREQGMYYGDIGIFFIEMNNLTEDIFEQSEEMSQIMSSLILWAKFDKPLIVVLSKADCSDFSEDTYLYASMQINEICNKANLNPCIIPISIEVTKRIGHNIFTKSEKMPWYEGEPFIKELESNLNNIKISNDSNLLFYIDRQYSVTSSYSGKCWRIKILNGELRKNETIVLSPIKYKNEFISVTAKVKNIRYDINNDEDKQELDFAIAGSIVGVDITDIYYKNHRLSKDDIDAIYTTCGFQTDKTYTVSDMIEFEVDTKIIDHFSPNKLMVLFWFGRSTPIQICSLKEKDTFFIVTAKLSARKISFPLKKDGSYFYDNIIIKDPTKDYGTQYYDAKLLRLL